MISVVWLAVHLFLHIPFTILRAVRRSYPIVASPHFVNGRHVSWTDLQVIGTVDLLGMVRFTSRSADFFVCLSTCLFVWIGPCVCLCISLRLTPAGPDQGRTIGLRAQWNKEQASVPMVRLVLLSPCAYWPHPLSGETKNLHVFWRLRYAYMATTGILWKRVLG